MNRELNVGSLPLATGPISQDCERNHYEQCDKGNNNRYFYDRQKHTDEEDELTQKGDYKKYESHYSAQSAASF